MPSLREETTLDEDDELPETSGERAVDEAPPQPSSSQIAPTTTTTLQPDTAQVATVNHVPDVQYDDVKKEDTGTDQVTEKQNADQDEKKAGEANATGEQPVKKTHRNKYLASFSKKWPADDWKSGMVQRKMVPTVKKRRPVFPVEKIHQMLIGPDESSTTIDSAVPIFLSGVEEYITMEVLELSGNLAMTRGSTEVCDHDLVAAIFSDKDLRDTLRDCVRY